MRRMVIMRSISATLSSSAQVITERVIRSDTFNESNAAPCTAKPVGDVAFRDEAL